MKTKILMLILLTVFTSSSIFASGNTINANPKAVTSFNRNFSDARNVSWKKTENYLKAKFDLNGQVMFAYYDDGGELMGVLRNITTSVLPLNLQTRLKPFQADGWITELFEFSTSEGTVYYTTIESATQKVSLKSTSTNSWSVNKRMKKI